MDERLLLTSLKFVKQKQYWQTKLSNIEDIAGAKFLDSKHRQRKQEHQENKESVEISIPGDICEEIMRLSNESPLTIYIILLAALKSLLYRYGGGEDIVILSPVYEPNVMEDTLNGLLAVRDRIHGKLTFKQLLLQLSQSVREAYENQDYPFDEFPQSSSISNIACLLESIHDAGNIEKVTADDKILFSFNFEKEEKRINGKVTFNPGIYENHYVERISRHYCNILGFLVKNIDAEISGISFLTEKEKQQLIYDFNDTVSQYPRDRLIHELFEEQVERDPDHIALIGKINPKSEIRNPKQIQMTKIQNSKPGGTRGLAPLSVHTSITYRELNKKSNQLAHLLIEKGIKPGTIAGIMLERSMDMAVSIWALLKAGGTYVPIDPTTPGQRIKTMLESSGVSLVLSHSSYPAGGIHPHENISMILPDQLEKELARQSIDNLVPASSPGDLLYVIFTSGSTGTPKGAAAYHRGFMNLVHWFNTEFALTAADRNLLITSMSFDLTQKNLYASLMTGGTLCLPGVDYFDPGVLLEDIGQYRVTWLNCTPGMFSRLVDYEMSENGKRLACLRYVFLGGEPISAAELIRWWESDHCRGEIVNTYGPTECTDICASYRIKDLRRFMMETIPIGRPVYNTRLYVLDNNLRLVPVGIPGELFIGGDGVGIGYVNDRQLTAEKFITHSFSPQDPGQLLYRTGDLVKRHPDGNIEFIGRLDHQVKIRGFRIELEEIENHLLNHDAIKQTVVTVHIPTPGAAGGDTPRWERKYLCAYVVSHGTIDVMELKEWLAAQLPQYMVPTYFIPLETLPLTPNGKVDRNALPDPEAFNPVSETSYAPPGTHLEKIIADTWKEVLNLEKVGVNDNFFNVGGNSLEIGRLASKLREDLDRDIEFITLFQFPTIRSLARYLAPGESGESSENHQVETARRANEINQAQRRLRQRIKKSKKVNLS
jgi:amino acid adenylation domain-containing protein